MGRNENKSGICDAKEIYLYTYCENVDDNNKLCLWI